MSFQAPSPWVLPFFRQKFHSSYLVPELLARILACTGILVFWVCHFPQKSVPNQVKHVGRCPWFFLDFLESNWESAEHFYFSMDFFRKYRGKIPPIFFFKKRGEIFCFCFSSPRTAFLRSRRFDRHPSWNNCMHRKLHAHVHAWWNCMQ